MRRRLILLSLICISISQSFYAQNYSQFCTYTEDQTWTLYDVTHTDLWTIVDIRVLINNNKTFSLYIKSDTHISGSWGCVNYARYVEINNRVWNFDKAYIFGERNKGKFVPVRIWFSRVPGGMSSFNYCEPGFAAWNKIPILNNPNTEHTKWTRNELIRNWEENGIGKIEGIYDFVYTNNRDWWGTSKHSIGIVKNGSGYDIIYLAGSAYPDAWEEGDLKGRISATSVAGLFKTTLWLMEGKQPSKNAFYVSFDANTLYINENDENVKTEFLKVYPTAEVATIDENITSAQNSTEPSQRQLKATGSGFLVTMDGVVATNYHVIDGANSIDVCFNNGVNTYSAKVLAVDKTNDIALLKITGETIHKSLPYSLSLKTQDVGTPIFSMGYPQSQFLGDEIKVTNGIINSKTGFQGDIVTYQISATIAPGSSGGALFNNDGEIVGLTNAGITETEIAQNVNYAIKSIYLYTLMESASIEIPTHNSIKELSLQDKIKAITPFIAYIKIY